MKKKKRKKSLAVLYVDDGEGTEDILLVAKLALEDLGGFRTSVCSSGHEAVKMVQKMHHSLHCKGSSPSRSRIWTRGIQWGYREAF